MLFLAVIFTAFAVSYAWGMRGCIIGGEKGALLPGAVLGLCIARFVCGGKFSFMYLFFAGAGALSMFYGGTATYGQNMGFVLHPERKGYENKFFHALFGIFLKGGLWFAISSGVLAMLVGTLSGKIYSPAEYTVLFALIPVFTVVGPKIFNSPYDKENKRFPKIYFSLDRYEEWGGNVLLVLALLVLSAVNKDFFTLGAIGTGFLSGGIGFSLGLLMYRFCNVGIKGHLPFGDLQRKGYISGWKIMEHAFGAIGGGSVMLYFYLNADTINNALSDASFSALPFSGEKDVYGGIAVIVMLFISVLLYPLQHLLEKRNIRLKDRTYELLGRPLWSAFPLILIFMGSKYAAAAAAFITVCFALCEKCSLEWFNGKKIERFIQVSCAVLLLSSLIFFFCSDFVTNSHISIIPVLLYTFAHTVPAVLHSFSYEKRADRLKQNKGIGEYYTSALTVIPHFVIQSVTITAVFCF